MCQAGLPFYFLKKMWKKERSGFFFMKYKYSPRIYKFIIFAMFQEKIINISNSSRKRNVLFSHKIKKE
jgi:hypothetical protein